MAVLTTLCIAGDDKVDAEGEEDEQDEEWIIAEDDASDRLKEDDELLNAEASSYGLTASVSKESEKPTIKTTIRYRRTVHPFLSSPVKSESTEKSYPMSANSCSCSRSSASSCNRSAKYSLASASEKKNSTSISQWFISDASCVS
jgi:hypothetical protein